MFAAGAVGALANSLVVWACGRFGITAALQVSIAPALTLAWLYPRIVWGGLWGGLLLIPFPRRRWFLQSFVISCGPTAFQLLVVFPERLHKGFLGLELGLLTPAFVFVFNLVWAVTAVAWLRLARSSH